MTFPQSTAPRPLSAGNAVSSVVLDLPRPKQTCEIVRVTPDMAAAFLLHNTHNRLVSKTYLARWAKAMLAGLWMLTGEAIIFDWNGTLLDGQHRLLAVIESGVACDFVIVRGIDPGAFPFVNMGKIRNGKDALDVAGYLQTRRLAAAVKVINCYALSRSTELPMVSVMPSARLDPNGVLRMAAEYPGLSDWLQSGCKVSKSCPALTSEAAVSAALFLGARAGNDETVREFVELIDRKVGIQEGAAPAALLNTRPIQGMNRSGETGQAISFDLTAKALRAWLDHRPVRKVLNWKREDLVDLGPARSVLDLPDVDGPHQIPPGSQP